MSHSDELVLVAVARSCEVGVDVERLRAVSYCEQIARRYFHEAEADAIRAAEPAGRAAAFLRCWTAKEAILKAKGLGLRGELGSFQVPIEEHDGAWVQMADHRATRQAFWLQPLVPFIGYMGAVALMGENRRVRTFTCQF